MMSVLSPNVNVNDVNTCNKTTTVISPLIRIHKGWKFLKHKNKTPQANATKYGGEVKRKPNVSERELETTNLLKRIYSYRASKNKKKEATIILPSLSIVKWSSCESISDEKFGRKFNSLRRSRASLIVPSTSGDYEVPYNNNKAKIPQFQNKGCVYKNNNTILSPVIQTTENVVDSSTEPFIEVLNELNSSISKFSEEIAQEVEQIFNNNATPLANNSLDRSQSSRLRSKKPACHSLSLPNINENKIEGSTNNVNNITNTINKDNNSLSPFFQTDNMIEKRRYSSTSCVEDDNLAAESTKYSSVLSLNSRPPIPCCPKPIDRRDSILKSRSTETLQKSYKNISTECLAKKRLNSSPEGSTLRKVEVRKSADFSQLGKDEVFHDSLTSREYMSTSDLPNLVCNEKLWKKALSCCQLPYSIVEAVWDHTSLKDEELNFSSGDIIHVLFVEDENWWWGLKGDQKGWFPAVYVRKCLFQDISGKDVNENINCDTTSPCQSKEYERQHGSEKMKLVRSKCVEELLTTEIDYVQLLKNIIEGYLEPVLRDETLFEIGDAETLFGNICELYAFHKEFVKELQNAVNQADMDISCVGKVFLKHECEFQIYSQYCNNQPGSSARLSSLTKDKRYRCFFEKCRLKQNMIRLSLDGFLLSPVQRICKYPLQLKELLKHTYQEHQDFEELQLAHSCMQNVASLVNERKRCLENVHNLAMWQHSIVDWRGEAVALRSTEIIHTGTLYKVLDQRMPERVAYLFDHQLIYFRKYSTKRHNLKYCGRICLDNAKIINIEDNTIEIGGFYVVNGWKIWDTIKGKWHLFYANSFDEKSKWISAFEKEKQYVKDEVEKGFTVSISIREAAIDNALSRHLNDNKRRRMRRKSALPVLLDATGVPTAALAFPSVNLNKTENIQRRSSRRQSARWSLGSLFEKYM